MKAQEIENFFIFFLMELKNATIISVSILVWSLNLRRICFLHCSLGFIIERSKKVKDQLNIELIILEYEYLAMAFETKTYLYIKVT